jgi:hypothetical protein
MGSKKTIILSAVVMACLGTGLGMLSQSKSASAALLVIDVENILQATKQH